MNEGFALDDQEVSRLKYSSVCSKCKHLRELWSCKAFDEIPLEIWNGENDHTEPYPGDHGIQFEKAESE